jgi:chromosome segregation ATPase
MLLDDLMAQREHVQKPQIVDPVLTVDPVAVPALAEVGRKAQRQRLSDLEQAARHNLRSAEEARQVLREEHERLNAEATARTKAQQEAASLRRELDRLRDTETRRAAKEKTRAEQAARAEIANELKRFQDEHDRVVREFNQLRGNLTDHDTLLDEYNARLREEQQARAAMRAEVERAEAARLLAERSLEAAASGARRRAEDEMIRLATAEQELADARSDCERLRSKIDELTAGDGAMARLTADLQARELDLGRADVRIADLEARIQASEDAAAAAIAERDDALRTAGRIEDAREASEQAKVDSDLAVDVARARIAELESTAETRVIAAADRADAAERALEQLRREAAEATSGRRAAEGALTTMVSERDELRARLAEVESQLARHDASVPAASVTAEPISVDPPAAEIEHAPLPTRVAGQRAATFQPLVRRARNRPAAPVERAQPSEQPAWAALRPRSGESGEPAAAPAFVAVEPEDAPVPAEPVGTFRRTAMAELTAIASANGDEDSSFRRR